MLTSIATIAGAVTALVGFIYFVKDSLKKSKLKKWENDNRSLEKQLLEAETNEDRKRLSKLLSDHRAK
jgi:hypothetical protein